MLKGQEELEIMFRNLAWMYLKMRDTLLPGHTSGDPQYNITARLNATERAIEEFLKIRSEVSLSTLRNIEEFKKQVNRITTENFDKLELYQFCQKLNSLIDEFIGRAIDIRDGTYESPPCSGCWHINS